MKQGNELFTFFEACAIYLQSELESTGVLKSGIQSFLPVLLHSAADLTSKLKAKRNVSILQYQTMSRSLQCFLQPVVLRDAHAEVVKSKPDSPPTPSTGSPVTNITTSSIAWALSALSWDCGVWESTFAVLSLAAEGLVLLGVYHSIPRCLELVGNLSS